MTEQTDAITVVCEHCGRELECCAFCDRVDCGHAACGRCVRVELRESIDHPHPHGG